MVFTHNNSDPSMALISVLAQVGKSSQPSTGMQELPEGFQPGPCDVICARGAFAKTHPGNIRFNELVALHLSSYSKATSRTEKSVVVSKIIDAIRDDASPEGGFVKQKQGRWYDAGEQVAREKVGQRLRDLLHSKYSSSSRAKKRRRRENEAILASQVEDIMSLSQRVEQLVGTEKPKWDDDAQMQSIFNQANIELLRSLCAGNSSATTSPLPIALSAS